MKQQGIDAGLTPDTTEDFVCVPLNRQVDGDDWLQPMGSIALAGDFGDDSSIADLTIDLQILIDTGIDEMILWLSADDVSSLPQESAFPAGISVSVSVPPTDQSPEPALHYSFVTGDGGQPMAPSHVEWRLGNGINTGRNVLAGADYLYDGAGGNIGFRVPPG